MLSGKCINKHYARLPADLCVRMEVLGCLLEVLMWDESAEASWPQSLSPAVPTTPRRGWGQRQFVGRDVCLLVLAREYQPSAEVLVVVTELWGHSCESGADMQPFPQLRDVCVLRSAQCCVTWRLLSKEGFISVAMC